jgi:hypothetical protein
MNTAWSWPSPGKPLVCNGNVATAGGCLSAVYLAGWVAVERLFGIDKRKEKSRQPIPTGQSDLYNNFIESSIRDIMPKKTNYDGGNALHSRARHA